MIIQNIGTVIRRCTLCSTQEHGHEVPIYASYYKGIIGVGNSVEEAISNSLT